MASSSSMVSKVL